MKLVRADEGSFVPASHEDQARPGVLKRVIATRQDILKGQIMMVNWAQLPGGSSFQRHYHEDMQEVFVLLSGKVRMTVGEAICEVTAGDTVIVDPREVHEMQNLQQTPAEYIVFGVSTEEGGRTVVELEPA